MAEGINNTPLSEEERKGLAKKVEMDMRLDGLPTTNEGFIEESLRFSEALERMMDLAFRIGYLTALRKIDGKSENPLSKELRSTLRSFSRMSELDMGLDRPTDKHGGHEIRP